MTTDSSANAGSLGMEMNVASRGVELGVEGSREETIRCACNLLIHLERNGDDIGYRIAALSTLMGLWGDYDEWEGEYTDQTNVHPTIRGFQEKLTRLHRRVFADFWKRVK